MVSHRLCRFRAAATPHGSGRAVCCRALPKGALPSKVAANRCKYVCCCQWTRSDSRASFTGLRHLQARRAKLTNPRHPRSLMCTIPRKIKLAKLLSCYNLVQSGQFPFLPVSMMPAPPVVPSSGRTCNCNPAPSALVPRQTPSTPGPLILTPLPQLCYKMTGRGGDDDVTDPKQGRERGGVAATHAAPQIRSRLRAWGNG